ncbi:MAG: SagB family peptide dehydrogenase [Pseudomonadota bacterium]
MSEMRAILRNPEHEAHLATFLAHQGVAKEAATEIICALGGAGLDIAAAAPALVEAMARAGYAAISVASGALTVIPVRVDFKLPEARAGEALTPLKLSRFQSMQAEAGVLTAKSPLGDAAIKLHDPRLASLIAAFQTPMTAEEALTGNWLKKHGGAIIEALLSASILLPCDRDGLTEEDRDPGLRMWDAPELTFHSRSRLGRPGAPIGATWQHRGEIEPPRALKENPWEQGAIALYQPAQLSRDMPLYQAMESRRSIRHYSKVPLSAMELGEFLYRTMRIREVSGEGEHETARRPYPNGGALWEQELYVTIDACLDLPRGFYYYDALHHRLCPVHPHDHLIEALLEDAVNATARTGRPQVLFTIAARFARFNWKYSGMGYAAQLKNVGAIYQTMYLVATAMGIGGCGLGLGNSDLFARLTGLDYTQEGSIGEFMIGRPV